MKGALPLVQQKVASSPVACWCINLVQKNKILGQVVKISKLTQESHLQLNKVILVETTSPQRNNNWIQHTSRWCAVFVFGIVMFCTGYYDNVKSVM
jgi:hypothetical protein